MSPRRAVRGGPEVGPEGVVVRPPGLWEAAQG
jgi:hypothetical protein